MNRRILFRLALGLAALALNAPAQQTITVTNAASYKAFPLSPGCWGTVFGTFAGVAPTPAGSLPFPATLGGVQVLVNDVPAPMNFAGPTQINFLVPKTTPEGPVTLRVTVGGSTVAQRTITIFPFSPGLISLNPADVTQPAAALNQDNTVNTQQNPARRGEVVQLFGVGGDYAELPADDGASAPTDRQINTESTPVGYILEQPAVVQFSGLAPGLVNAWQLNLVIPNLNFISGQVPVNASISGVDTNDVSIWVAE